MKIPYEEILPPTDWSRTLAIVINQVVEELLRNATYLS